jgi:2-hydroxychromene-2-carboxylate isomerase
LDPALPPVRLWADPSCPWTWITVTWLAEVAQRRGFELNLRLVSLALIDARLGVGRRPAHRAGLALENVIMAARLEHGPGVALPLYLALGHRIHVQRRDIVGQAQAILSEALTELGLGLEPLTIASNPGTGAALMAEHDAAIALVGDNAVGSPILALGETAFFGPVLGQALHGQAADQLFDAIVTVATTPGFAELKRSRTTGPQIEGRTA